MKLGAVFVAQRACGMSGMYRPRESDLETPSELGRIREY